MYDNHYGFQQLSWWEKEEKKLEENGMILGKMDMGVMIYVEG